MKIYHTLDGWGERGKRKSYGMNVIVSFQRAAIVFIHAPRRTNGLTTFRMQNGYLFHKRNHGKKRRPPLVRYIPSPPIIDEHVAKFRHSWSVIIHRRSLSPLRNGSNHQPIQNRTSVALLASYFVLTALFRNPKGGKTFTPFPLHLTFTFQTLHHIINQPTTAFHHLFPPLQQLPPSPPSQPPSYRQPF